jgi:hypothetical protein
VIEVFQPFEIAYSHSSSIAKDVWQELNAFLKENLLSLQSGGPVSSLNNQFSLEAMSVVNID